MVRCHLVHVSCGVEVALTVVEGPVGDAFFGVCAVPGFAEVLCAAVDAAERGFDGALVCVGCAAVGVVDCLVPFVVYEAGAVAFDADGDGHGVDVADVFGEVSLLLVGETVPRVGERVHDAGGADTVARVNGGVVEGDFSADAMFGVRLDEVTGDAEIGDLNGLTEADGTVRQSRIILMSGDASVSRVDADSAIGRVDGGDVGSVDGGNVGFVSNGGRVESVLSGGRVGAVDGGGVVNLVKGSGVVAVVGAGGTVAEVDDIGIVHCVARGGRVDRLLGGSLLESNEGVVGFVGSPTAPADGNGGAVLADNRAGGRVECVRAGGVVDENVGEVDRVLHGGVVNGLRGGGEVGSLAGRVGYLGGPDAHVRSMGGSEGAWAEISLVRCSASVNEGDEMRVIPAVGFVGPYSRVSFETSSAEEALACIGRVDRGALEAGLVDIRYRGRMGESLLPLLREREGVSVVE